jgi:hypothetical protein
MDSKLLSLLTVLSTIITLLIATYIFSGVGYTIKFTIVSLLALITWLFFSFKNTPSQNKIVAPYILIIVLVLVLSTCRYWSEYSSFFYSNWNSFFAVHFTLTHVSWMIFSAFAPVSIMLLGGYYLTKQKPIGFYMAWWTFFYGITESLFQYKIEFGLNQNYIHNYYLGSITAIALLTIGLIGILRLIKNSDENTTEIQHNGLTPKQINIWTVFLVSLVTVYGISLYSQAGLLPVGVIVGSMMGGLIGWRKTTALHPADPYKVVPLYLLLQCFFFIHVAEEAVSPIPFNQMIATISGTAWPDTEFTFLIALIGPVVWVFGAWSLWLRQPFGNFILWFMIVGMIVGEPTHLLIFPVVSMNKFGIGYEYFSGMYTALFPMIPAILALVFIISDHKKRAKEKILNT